MSIQCCIFMRDYIQASDLVSARILENGFDLEWLKKSSSDPTPVYINK